MLTIKIEGMACDGCVRSVRKAIAAADPAAQAEIDLATGIARVRSDKPDNEFVKAIEAAGYDVVPAA